MHKIIQSGFITRKYKEKTTEKRKDEKSKIQLCYEIYTYTYI